MKYSRAPAALPSLTKAEPFPQAIAAGLVPLTMQSIHVQSTICAAMYSIPVILLIFASCWCSAHAFKVGVRMFHIVVERFAIGSLGFSKA